MNFNKELLMVFVPGLSWILFALGGTEINPSIGGIKPFRSVGLPILFGVAALTVVVWWQALLTAVTTFGILSLSSYGSKYGWGRRTLTIVAFGLIGVTLGLSFWNLFFMLWFFTLYLLSNFKPTASTFIWKIVEGSVGAFIGVQVTYSLMGHGLTWLR